MVTGTANSTMGPIKNELHDLSSSSWSDSNSRISTSPNLNVVTTTTSSGPNPMALDHHSGHTHSSQKKSASDTRRVSSLVCLFVFFFKKLIRQLSIISIFRVINRLWRKDEELVLTIV